jgi:hypothetical protein
LAEIVNSALGSVIAAAVGVGVGVGVALALAVGVALGVFVVFSVGAGTQPASTPTVNATVAPSNSTVRDRNSLVMCPTIQPIT